MANDEKAMRLRPRPGKTGKPTAAKAKRGRSSTAFRRRNKAKELVEARLFLEQLTHKPIELPG